MDVHYIFAGIFWLILAGLFVKNWPGVNAALQTSLSGGNQIIATLQHP